MLGLIDISLYTCLLKIAVLVVFNYFQVKLLECHIFILNDTTTIKAFMFAECDKLNKISEAENVNEIQKGAFTHCESLEELVLLNAKFIGDYAFDGCESLKRLDLPNVTTIGKCVFRNCSSELKIYTKSDKLPLFTNAFVDSFENHRNQFIV